MAGPRKILFKSPTDGEELTKEKSHSAEMETLLNKIQVEIEVENNLNIVEKELHEKRLAKMRELLKNIEGDEWMFGKIEDHISF